MAKAAKRKTVRAKFVKAKLEPKARRQVRKGKVLVRADKGAEAKVAIDRLPEPHRAIARAADAMIRRTVPGTTGVVKWGNAVYQVDGRSYCTIYQTRAGVNLGLPGAKLRDPGGLLEGTGELMRHVKLASAADARRPAVAALVKAAAKIGIPRM